MTADKALPAETLIDASTLAKKLNVHAVTIRKWQSSGRIPSPVRIGAAVRWRLVEIDAWIRARCPPRSSWTIMWNMSATKSGKHD